MSTATQPESGPEQRIGVAYGLLAYGLWGVFPLFWPLLKPAPVSELLAERIVWSLVVVGILLLVRTRGAALRGIGRRQLGLAAIAALLIGLNWMTYIWGVTSAHVVECALGYFINPLVTVLLGVVVLGERLRQAQWVALGFSAVSVIILAIDYGRPPWIALAVASTFAFYSLVKKRSGLGALPSLAIEMTALAPLALLYLITVRGGTFFTGGTVHALLLASTGIVTAVPLLAFGAAANRVPLSVIGLLQYVSPTLQLLCGVVVGHEPMAPTRWVGFGLVWIGLVIFATDGVRELRRSPSLAPIRA